MKKTAQDWYNEFLLTSTPGYYDPEYLKGLIIDSMKLYNNAIKHNNIDDANYFLGHYMYYSKVWGDQEEEDFIYEL